MDTFDYWYDHELRERVHRIEQRQARADDRWRIALLFLVNLVYTGLMLLLWFTIDHKLLETTVRWVSIAFLIFVGIAATYWLTRWVRRSRGGK